MASFKQKTGYSALKRACVIVLLAAILVPARARTQDSLEKEMYECVPSGFSIGIPPIRSFSEFTTGSVEITLEELDRLQEKLGELLARSGLFSYVRVYSKEIQADSTDLTLLLAIPELQELTSGELPRYHLTARLLLVENVSGETILQKTYEKEYDALFTGRDMKNYARAVYGFYDIVSGVIQDLNSILNPAEPGALEWNQSIDPVSIEFDRLRQTKKVTHLHLEPLSIIPTVVVNPAPGLVNYAGIIDRELRRQLERKNCFTFPDPSPRSINCLSHAGGVLASHVESALEECGDSMPSNGMLLISILSGDISYLELRVILYDISSKTTLYDQILSTGTGWQLGNTLNRHTAGVAQASHAIPH